MRNATTAEECQLQDAAFVPDTSFEEENPGDGSSYSAGVSVGGSHAPVVKNMRRAPRLSSPHLVAVSRYDWTIAKSVRPYTVPPAKTHQGGLRLADHSP